MKKKRHSPVQIAAKLRPSRTHQGADAKIIGGQGPFPLY
jgi:hypothetical protein